MPWTLSRPGFKSEAYRLGRHMGGPSREGFWMGLAEDVEWSAEVAEQMLTCLRSVLEQGLHTTAEIETALSKARSMMDNCHAGLRAHAHTLHEMSERASCVLCARPHPNPSFAARIYAMRPSAAGTTRLSRRMTTLSCFPS